MIASCLPVELKGAAKEHHALAGEQGNAASLCLSLLDDTKAKNESENFSCLRLAALSPQITPDQGFKVASARSRAACLMKQVHVVRKCSAASVVEHEVPLNNEWLTSKVASNPTMSSAKPEKQLHQMLRTAPAAIELPSMSKCGMTRS